MEPLTKKSLEEGFFSSKIFKNKKNDIIRILIKYFVAMLFILSEIDV